jgi:hypothetical protein
MTTERSPAHNSSYKKLAIQWLNEALCFVSSSVLADSFHLRNCQLLVAANRYERRAGGTIKSKWLFLADNGYRTSHYGYYPYWRNQSPDPGLYYKVFN